MKKLLQNCQTVEGMKDILIESERYAKITVAGEICSQEADEVIDLQGKIVIPGMTDPHVHVRDLDQCDKEDWTSCTKAALRSGITTIFDMPNTIPPTIDWAGLRLKQKAAEKSLIDYKFFLGVDPDNLVELDNILSAKLKEVAGIKLFLASSSQNEIIDDKITLTNLFLIAHDHDLVIAVHTELQRCLDTSLLQNADFTAQDHNNLRPRECAIEGLKLVLEVAKEIGNKLVICHVSTKEELDLIQAAKADGQQIYCEVTPHHLILDEAKTIEFGNWAKVNPPLRTPDDNRALLDGIKTGIVDFVGTDHAPHKLSEKAKTYKYAPSGFPGVETALPVLIDLMLKEVISLDILVHITSSNVNVLYGLDSSIKVNNKVNLVIIDPAGQSVISADNFVSKAKYSPFQGRILNGKIIDVIYSGKTSNL